MTTDKTPNYSINSSTLQFETARSQELASSIDLETTRRFDLTLEQIIRHCRVNHDATQKKYNLNISRQL